MSGLFGGENSVIKLRCWGFGLSGGLGDGQAWFATVYSVYALGEGIQPMTVELTHETAAFYVMNYFTGPSTEYVGDASMAPFAIASVGDCVDGQGDALDVRFTYSTGYDPRLWIASSGF